MPIGAYYSAISELIWFYFGRMMGQHVPHIMLKFQENILHSS